MPLLDPPDVVCCEHLIKFLNVRLLQQYTDFAARALAKHKFDSIAFRGMSGALIATPVSLALNKPLILIRKEEDVTHSSFKVEGNKACKRYVILDDFISSGETYKAIVTAVSIFAPKAKCIGLLSVQHIDNDGLTKSTTEKKPYFLYQG
jgi:adenine/guanine phosphoribosyltransferase-like PRPP-binding protein